MSRSRCEGGQREISDAARSKGNFQIHYALSRPPAWRGEGLGKVALLHLTPGLDGTSKACNEAVRGMLIAAKPVTLKALRRSSELRVLFGPVLNFDGILTMQRRNPGHSRK